MTLKQDLEKIAKKYDIDPTDFINVIGCNIETFLTAEQYKVPNVKRYTVTTNPIKITALANNPPSSGFENYSHNITCLCGKPKIVIILESPHINEYTKLPCNSVINNCANKPITPANGITGKQIENNLPLTLQKLNDLKVLTENEYEICIVNPVPFQTSLGSSTNKMNEELKIEIWKYLWNNNPKIQKDFIALLETIPNHSIVINSCTSYSHFHFIKETDQYSVFTQLCSAYTSLANHILIDTIKKKRLFTSIQKKIVNFNTVNTKCPTITTQKELDFIQAYISKMANLDELLPYSKFLDNQMKSKVEQAILNTISKLTRNNIFYAVTNHPSSQSNYTKSIDNMNILDLSK